MTFEEKETNFVVKFGFIPTDHPDCYLRPISDQRRIKLWIDDKITIYSGNAKVFQLDNDDYGFDRADKYLTDLMGIKNA